MYALKWRIHKIPIPCMRWNTRNNLIKSSKAGVYIKITPAFIIRLCHIIWLIFDGRILWNTSYFVRLQTTMGLRPHEMLVFLVFFSSNRWKGISAKINHPLWHSLCFYFLSLVVLLFPNVIQTRFCRSEQSEESSKKSSQRNSKTMHRSCSFVVFLNNIYKD